MAWARTTDPPAASNLTFGRRQRHARPVDLQVGCWSGRRNSVCAICCQNVTPS